MNCMVVFNGQIQLFLFRVLEMFNYVKIMQVGKCFVRQILHAQFDRYNDR